MTEVFYPIFPNNLGLLLITAASLGLICGTFLNVVIGRLPTMILDESVDVSSYNLAIPGSHCPSCESNISWYDNIPIVSYLILQGKCRACKASIPLRYLLVELITSFIFVMTAYIYGGTLEAIVLAVALTIGLALFLIDLKHMLLPDALTYSLLWLGLLWSLSPESKITPDEAITAVAITFVLLYVISWSFILIKKKAALGHGDIKLFSAIIAFVGIESLGILLILSSILAVSYQLIRRLGHKTRGSDYFPFGPAIICSGIIIYIIG